MFLQMHYLSSYHASLLNRDNASLAKRIPFGDATRLRISSQCLKRHWRMDLQRNLDLPSAIRTRHFFGREVLARLQEERQVEPALAESLVRTLAKTVLSTSDGSKDPLDQHLRMKQPVLFGRPEADFFVDLLAGCAVGPNPTKTLVQKLKVDRENFKAMLRTAGHGNLYAGVEGALFGRFVTSDILARSDAAVHVAHAFTVHPQDNEVDYFTVVDDLNLSEETGAAHAGDMDLGAGLFYGYVAIDVPLLVSNFTGCDPKIWQDQALGDAHRVLSAFMRAVPTVTPGAKLGSTAPYCYADFVLFEAGCQQPRSLANAYLEALRPQGDMTQRAVDHLLDYLVAQERSMAPPRADAPWPRRECGRKSLRLSRWRLPLTQFLKPSWGGRVMDILILRFDAPLMSFGGVMVDQHGLTNRFPGLSLLAGLCGNALGLSHADAGALEALQDRIEYAARWDVTPVPLVDYHTVDLNQQKMRNPSWTTRGRPEHRAGGVSARFGTHERYRHYWANGVMTIALTLLGGQAPEASVLREVLRQPARPLFLGRKTCLPATPILLDSLEATDVLEALRWVPRASRPGVFIPEPGMEACWPAHLELDAHEYEVAVYDRRDWSNQTVAGRRVQAEGRIILVEAPS